MSKTKQRQPISTKAFLPTTRAEMKKRGWRRADIILVTADAYVDHPSFGFALIGRWLESCGYRVAILAQPDWKSVDDFLSLGKPKLFWGITSGCVDSRLNDYASLGAKRKKDVYSPGGKTGLRPSKPLLTYSARAREAFKDVPIVLGGLGASLRRLVHFDYIEDKLKRSILADAKADILVHGMGETAIAEIAKRLKNGEDIAQIRDIAGTATVIKNESEIPGEFLKLDSLESQQNDSKLVLKSQIRYQKQCIPSGRAIVQEQNPGLLLVNPPAAPLSEQEMDQLYSLPYTLNSHPKYDQLGGIPALEPVRFSITTHRGCFGGCSFCSIYFHQGKQISSRSIKSVMSGVETIAAHRDFKGTIHDVGGPSANMYAMGCTLKKQCDRASCLFPSPCKHLATDYGRMLKLMNELVKWKNLRNKSHIFIASGVRFDLANMDQRYIKLLAKEFVGGHLKVAPEHSCKKVLSLMGKPSFDQYLKFKTIFERESRSVGKEQYIVPYFISSHPGATENDALELMEYLVSEKLRLRQVQDFTPVPLTLATAMYVSNTSPAGKPIFVAKGHKAKKLQSALIQYWLPHNNSILSEFLRSRKRMKLLHMVNGMRNYRR